MDENPYESPESESTSSTDQFTFSRRHLAIGIGVIAIGCIGYVVAAGDDHADSTFKRYPLVFLPLCIATAGMVVWLAFKWEQQFPSNR